MKNDKKVIMFNSSDLNFALSLDKPVPRRNRKKPVSVNEWVRCGARNRIISNMSSRIDVVLVFPEFFMEFRVRWHRFLSELGEVIRAGELVS